MSTNAIDLDNLKQRFEDNTNAIRQCTDQTSRNTRSIIQGGTLLLKQISRTENEVAAFDARIRRLEHTTTEVLRVACIIIGLLAGLAVGLYLKLSGDLLLAPIILGGCLTLIAYSIYMDTETEIPIPRTQPRNPRALHIEEV